MSNWYPPPSRPRPVDGGLKARSKKGAIAQTWWSERFITVLESIGVGGRLQRGRTYARKGQVIDLDVQVGAATASVQGSRARPYRVRIGLTPFDKSEWNRVTEILSGDAWYTATLLAGAMPPDLEEVFASVGLSLFPTNARELSMDCTCPDWEVPCKHLAAVFYLLAEQFDEDPFTILAWRGREREELLATLSALRSGGLPADRAEASGAAVALAECLDSFFVGGADLPRRPLSPTASDSLLDQLPPVGVAVRGEPLIDLLRPAYRALGVEPLVVETQ